MPVTLIGEAVFARCLSAIKDERVRSSKIFPAPNPQFTGDRKQFIDDIRQALYASKIISYAQVARGLERVQVDFEQLRYRIDVAWWLHHSLRLLSYKIKT